MNRAAIIAGAAVIGALSLSGCSSAAGEETAMRQLTVGECVDFGASVTSDSDAVGGDGTSSLPAVDCAEEHDGEVFAVEQTTLDEFDEEALIAEVDELCYAEFDDYVGTAFADSSLYYSLVYPTGSTWNQGDRMLACVLVAETRSTGSAEGSGL